MIRVITITQQPGSGGAQQASLIARKFGWELLDHHLVDGIARIADLDVATADHFDKQAARWWRSLRQAGTNPAACCSCLSPRWLDEVDEDSVHDLATRLVQAAAHSGECVIVAHGPNACCRADRTCSMFLSTGPQSNESRTCRPVGLNIQMFTRCS